MGWSLSKRLTERLLHPEWWVHFRDETWGPLGLAWASQTLWEFHWGSLASPIQGWPMGTHIAESHLQPHTPFLGGLGSRPPSEAATPVCIEDSVAQGCPRVTQPDFLATEADRVTQLLTRLGVHGSHIHFEGPH